MSLVYYAATGSGSLNFKLLILMRHCFRFQKFTNATNLASSGVEWSSRAARTKARIEAGKTFSGGFLERKRSLQEFRRRLDRILGPARWPTRSGSTSGSSLIPPPIFKSSKFAEWLWILESNLLIQLVRIIKQNATEVHLSNVIDN